MPLLATTPFLAPGIAWFLVVAFSVLWIALGVAWGRQGRGDADDYMLAGRNIGLSLSTAPCWHRNSDTKPGSGACSATPWQGSA
jgi:hypothetical protein